MSEILRNKLACSYYFIVPALAFGTLSARLPALKASLTLNDSQIGSLLLGLGISTLVGLFLADFLIERKGARLVTALAALALMIFMSVAAYASSFTQMLLFLIAAGLGVGFCDVGMNALGIYLEQTRNIHCLAFLHACSGIGGVCGSLTGFVFASFGLSPFWNFAVVLGCFTLIWPLAFRETPLALNPARQIGLGFRKIPAFLFFCAVMNLLCHIVEGSCGEWGSILLTSIKGASQQTGALVFAAFTGGLVIIRLLTDQLRYRISDYMLVLAGSLFGFGAMALILLSRLPWLCLCGYALLGFAVGPITPVLFSVAGAVPKVTPGEASAVVSIFSYAGLLLFPPFFGMLGQSWGLVNALWLIAFFCLCMACGSLPLKSRQPRG